MIILYHWQIFIVVFKNRTFRDNDRRPPRIQTITENTTTRLEIDQSGRNIIEESPPAYSDLYPNTEVLQSPPPPPPPPIAAAAAEEEVAAVPIVINEFRT